MLSFLNTLSEFSFHFTESKQNTKGRKKEKNEKNLIKYPKFY